MPSARAAELQRVAAKPEVMNGGGAKTAGRRPFHPRSRNARPRLYDRSLAAAARYAQSISRFGLRYSSRHSGGFVAVRSRDEREDVMPATLTVASGITLLGIHLIGSDATAYFNAYAYDGSFARVA